MVGFQSDRMVAIPKWFSGATLLALPALERSGRHLVLRRPRGGLEAHRVYWKKGFELNDFSKDPSEQHNLAEKMPAKVADLKAKLQAFKKDTGAILPIVNPKADPSFKKW